MAWLLDKVFGIDEEEQRARELGAALAAENKKDLDSGFWSAEQYQAAEANRLLSGGDGAGGDFEFSDDVEGAFKEGFNDGVANVRGTIGSIVSLPFSLIPWQVWLIGAVVLFFYFGGGVLIRRKVTSA